jgi:hypothetical protein
MGGVRFYIEAVEKIIGTVAEHYHPEQKEAILEICKMQLRKISK